jgi:Fe-S cluster biogenesis protein NfuA
MSEEEEKKVSSEAPASDVLDRIENTINKIRPYIQADGGDVQLVDFKDGVVTVRMIGACAGCIAIDTTLTEGIQAILMDEVPEVKSVKLAEPDLSAAPNPYSWY